MVVVTLLVPETVLRMEGPDWALPERRLASRGPGPCCGIMLGQPPGGLAPSGCSVHRLLGLSPLGPLMVTFHPAHVQIWEECILEACPSFALVEGI